jgi:hypothetical protein
MTTVADLVAQTRRSLHDWPKLRVDTGTGDGVSDFFDLGKDISVSQNSEVVKVASVTKIRGSDYTLDYDANQILFVPAQIPANAASISVRYKEQVWREELIIDGLNAGRKTLFPRFYAKDSGTLTIRQNVRTYQLDGADMNEPNMRTVFGQGRGTFKILRTMVQPLGASIDQLWVPYRRRWQEWRSGHPYLHFWQMLGVGDVVRVEIMYGFTPFALASDSVDIPDFLQELAVLWACSSLALKTEPQRGRLDTANVMQSNFANPPGTMAQTAEDFQRKYDLMWSKLNSEPPVFDVPDLPMPWEASRQGYA